MDKWELSQYKPLGRELKLCQEEYQELRLADIQRNSGAQAEKEPPRRSGIPQCAAYVEDSPADIRKECAAGDERRRLEQLARRMENIRQERQAIRDFVEEVPDSELRQIITLRYLRGYSWAQTARRMGEGYTGDGMRMRAKRYLSSF